MAVPQCTYITPVTFDALWSVTPDGVEEPSLIEEWSVSDDGLTWRLKLREGIPFHPGFPRSS
jgi:peptide/nickel transport system substrate-binding protein